MNFGHLIKFVLLNCLSYFQGANSDTAASPDAAATDGELYIKKLLDKDNIAEKPEYLLFTAPYRLCEGGCDPEDDTNFAMAFPVFLGNKGRKAFDTMYPNAKKKLNELFTTKSPRPPYTTCPPERPTANLNTKSTMYPGYSIITTQSTGYPGYSINSGRTLSTGFPGYAELMKTWSTGFPNFDKLLGEAIRARYGQPEEYGANYPERENERDYKNGIRSGEMQQFKQPWIRRTVSLEEPSTPPLMWRPTQPPTKHQDTYIADLVNRRHNKWSLLFGYRPVLPIRDKK